MKRSKDLTTAFVDAYYGKPARRNYQIGGSRAGQEGLQAVQRYYADFDGVVSYYPAAQSQSLNLAWNRLWTSTPSIPPAARSIWLKKALLAKAVIAACDFARRCGGRTCVGHGRMPQSVQRELIALPRRSGRWKRLPIRSTDRGAKCRWRRHSTSPSRCPVVVDSVGPWPAFILGDLEMWFWDGAAGSQQAFYRATSVRPEAMTSTGLDYQIWKRRTWSRVRSSTMRATPIRRI